MKKTLVLFLFLSLVVVSYGKKTIVLKELVNPVNIAAANDNLFVSDGYSVFVYDLKSFKMKMKFGRKGKGPGEFSWKPRISVFKKFLFFNDQAKLMWFSFNGKLIREIRKTAWGKLYPIKKNFVLQKVKFDAKNRKVNVSINLLDKNMKKIKNLYNYVDESVDIMLSSDSGREIKKMIPHYRNIMVDDENIYMADSGKGFFIQVFDADGNKANTINLKVKDIPVSSEYKKRAIEKLKESKKRWEMLKNRRFVFYKIFPKIKSFFVKDGRIYVLTYKEKNNENEFIIMDNTGKILKKIFLPAVDIWTFDYNKYYYLRYDEKTDEYGLTVKEIM